LISKHSGVLTLENLSLDGALGLPLPGAVKTPVLKDVVGSVLKEAAATGSVMPDRWMLTIWSLRF
jgi:hypothetical protein